MFGSYPDVVNENATRIVAGVIFTVAVTLLLFPNLPLLVFLVYGFLARLSYGPRFEPVAWAVSQFVVPRFRISFVPTAGPPKRFAQFVGTLFSIASLGLFLWNQEFAYQLVLGILTFFASLEAFLGWCCGCWVFRGLMQIGIVPQEVCERCNNLTWNKEA